ncbi:MAG: RHS repeat-associated core domain-containing protein [Acidobacteriota bacterium]
MFNNSGYLISIADRNGNATGVTYDSSNRITQVTDAASRSVTFTYAGSSLQANTVQDSTGTIASYTYDGSQRLTRVTYPDGSQYNFAYDANYLLTGVTDAQGKTLETHTYDSSRRGLISARANNVEKVTVSYPSNTSTTLTDSLGNTTTFSYAFYGGAKFVTSVVGPTCSSCGAKTSNASTFDQSGNLITKTDANGNITTYTYDANGNVISRSTPVGDGSTQTWSYTYNSFGEVLTTTDPLNHVTTNAYDALGNLTSVTTPAPGVGINPSTTAFGYYPNGLLHTKQDPLGNVTTFAYYPNGLINTVNDAQNNVTSYAYDARGNRTNVTDANNNPTQYQYDSMNRIKNVSYPDNSTIQFSYDYRGRRTSVTDQNGRVTQYAYDDADRAISVTDAQTPTHGITQYAYDTENNLTSITDALNHLTTFTYDTNRRVSKVTFPSTLFESYAYDADGNLSTKTDRNGHVIQYHYDNLNRLTSKTYPDSSSINYIYDLAGRLTQVTDPTGTYGFAYDNVDRLASTTTQYAFLPGQTFPNAYTYDLASNRLSLTAPDGSITTYGYDTLNRLNGMVNSWAGSFGFGYDALSRRTSLTRPNGVNTSYGYDAVSHLLSVLHQAGANTLDGASYTYDLAGNRTSKTNYLNGVTLNYGYDPLYELTQVTQDGSTTESYSYDAVGNRLSSFGVPNYSYNTSNELTSNLVGSYTYDANGNTLTDSSGRQYSWDFENRLTQAIVPGQNGGTTTFKYDPFGRRIQKSGSLGTTNYVYDGPNLVEELDNGGNVLARYTNQMRVDEPLTELRVGTTSYYLQDGLGSVTSLSNGSGALANTYTFDSYGKLTASTGTLTNPFQYTGRESDQETGLYYYRARYYDSNVGRFISEDPIGLQGGPNFYAYVGNDPVDFNDPRGLLPRPRPPYRWRYCTANEVSECTKTCEAQGKEFESCRVSQTYRIIRLVNGGEWVDGPLSCSCKENDPECPKHRVRLPDITPVIEWGIIAGIGVQIIRTLPELAF